MYQMYVACWELLSKYNAPFVWGILSLDSSVVEIAFCLELTIAEIEHFLSLYLSIRCLMTYIVEMTHFSVYHCLTTLCMKCATRRQRSYYILYVVFGAFLTNKTFYNLNCQYLKHSIQFSVENNFRHKVYLKASLTLKVTCERWVDKSTIVQ